MHRGASFILLLVPTLNCFPIHTFHARRVTGEAHQRFVTRYGARTTDGGSLSSGDIVVEGSGDGEGRIPFPFTCEVIVQPAYGFTHIETQHDFEHSLA